jgi:hypothetical protein
VLVASLCLALFAAPASAGEDPTIIDWTSALPPVGATFEPASENLCRKGHVHCVDSVVREMTRRFDDIAASCSHDAPFAVTYLRVTEFYRQSVENPTFFQDNAFVNFEDAVFASYYFDAYDDWHAGRTGEVPAAWRIAFAAADARRVSGTGNLLLGVNAHVVRDLPFVLAGIGLAAPDGRTRKKDHDKVNEIFYRAYGPVVDEISDRFDPSVRGVSLEGTTLDESLLVQMLISWREEAWRNAERLVLARTAEERADVARSIENLAALRARELESRYSYGLLSSSAPRDAHCAAYGSTTAR